MTNREKAREAIDGCTPEHEPGFLCQPSDIVERVAAALDEKDAQIERLREALRRLNRHRDCLDCPDPDSHQIAVDLIFGTAPTSPGAKEAK